MQYKKYVDITMLDKTAGELNGSKTSITKIRIDVYLAYLPAKLFRNSTMPVMQKTHLRMIAPKSTHDSVPGHPER